MLTTTRRDKRNRRQAQFQLECLDDRIVLSAAGAVGPSIAHLGAVEHRLETRLARLEARNGDQLTPAVARIQARLAGIQARAAMIGGSNSATIASPRDPHGLLPVSIITGPNGLPIGGTDGAVSTSSGSGGSTTTTSATIASPRDPHGLLPVSIITGPNGLPIGGTD